MSDKNYLTIYQDDKEIINANRVYSLHVLNGGENIEIPPSVLKN